MKPEQSISERIETLMNQHLADHDIDRLAPAARDVVKTLGLGEWPVVLTDAMRSGELGLWVLTTERCLWLGQGGDTDDDELSWRDITSVSVRSRPQGHDLVLDWRDGAAVFVYADIGASSSWAAHLEWAVRDLAGLDRERSLYCPECLIGTHGAEDGECLICAAPLVALPGGALGDGPVASRLRRIAEPTVVERLGPAVELAERALTSDDWLWVVTDATVSDAPVLVVASESWIRVWDATGRLRIDEPHDDVTLVRSENVGPMSGIELVDISTGTRTALDNVGPVKWVDDLLSRIEAEPGEGVPVKAAVPGPVLGQDGRTRCPLCAEEIQPGAKICRFCRTDFRAAASELAVPEGGPRYIGVADLGGGVTVRRLFDAACYVIAGVALIVMAASTKDAGWAAVAGIGVIVYGGKIALTTTSYWVSTMIYLLAVLAIAGAIGTLQTST